MLNLEHYKAALKILEDPAFEKQEVLLHDYKDKYRSGTIHWGWTDDLCGRVLNLDEHILGYTYYAYIITDEFKETDLYQRAKTNSRYSVVPFSVVKKEVLSSINQKMIEAEAEEKDFLSKKKDKEEIKIPLSYEGKEFLLIEYHDNYADEFNVFGFNVFTKEDWEIYKNNIPKKSIHVGFGTNEDNNYPSKEDFLKTLTVKEITIDQAKTLFDLFGHKTIRCLDWNGRYHNKTVEYMTIDYGFFPSFDLDEGQ